MVASDYKVLVEVNAGKTIDMDDEQHPVLKSYSMVAPKGHSTVTPITTLVDFKMETENRSEKDATKQVAKKLGLPDGLAAADLLGDYVSKIDEKSQYLRIVAKKTAENTTLMSSLVTHSSEAISKVNDQLISLEKNITSKKSEIIHQAKENASHAKSLENDGEKSAEIERVKGRQIAQDEIARIEADAQEKIRIKGGEIAQGEIAKIEAEAQEKIRLKGAQIADNEIARIEADAKAKILARESESMFKNPLSTDFVFQIKMKGSGEFKIVNPTSVTTYSVDCNSDGKAEELATNGTSICNYSKAGTYTVRIRDTSKSADALSSLSFQGSSIIDVTQWGSERWKSFNSFFKNSSIERISAKDAPHLNLVKSMEHMFDHAEAFNQDLSWDVSNIVDMNGMFLAAAKFNGDISHWDVSNVRYMSHMFEGATAFNHDLIWNVSNVTDMDGMFISATHFNGDIRHWDVSSVTNMYGMFIEATQFDQDLSDWDVLSVANMENMFIGVARMLPYKYPRKKVTPNL